MNAKYTTRKTAIYRGLNIENEAEWLAEYGLKIEAGKDYAKIIENGEVTDTANYVLYFDETCGEWVGGLHFSEMNSMFQFDDGSYYSTCEDDGESLELNGHPLYVKRMMK